MTFREFLSALFGNREQPNELIIQEWTTLETLWRSCRDRVTDEALRSQIDALLPKDEKSKGRSAAADWAKLNMSEQLVALCLSEAQLDVEYRALDQLAKDRKLTSLKPLAEYLAEGEAIADDPKRLEFKRAHYLSSLHSLQSGFVTQRLHRKLRLEAAVRLFEHGTVVVVLALLPLLIHYLLHGWSVDPDALKRAQEGDSVLLFSTSPAFALTTAAVFGILGAYFSRVLAFHGALDTIDFNEFMKSYTSWMLRLRMLYGMIGAILFYYLIRGGLVGGDIFPDLAKLSIGEQPVWKAAADGTLIVGTNDQPEPSGLTVFLPTSDLAKLLVWSFIAGFSERMIPDSLSSLQARATKRDEDA